VPGNVQDIRTFCAKISEAGGFFGDFSHEGRGIVR
jgi:hypothetical protein